MTITEIKTVLDSFSRDHGLIEKAISDCKSVIDLWIAERKGEDGYLKDEIILEFENQKLLFNDCYDQSPLIVVQIGLYIKDPDNIYMKGLEPIGYYQIHVDANGKIIDDVFVIEKEKNEIDLKYYFKEFNTVLPKNGLNPTSMHFNYVNLVNRFLSFCNSKHFDLAIESAILAFEYSNDNGILLKNEYYRKTRKGIKRIVGFLFDKGLIVNDKLEKIYTLGLLKNKNGG